MPDFPYIPEKDRRMADRLYRDIVDGIGAMLDRNRRDFAPHSYRETTQGQDRTDAQVRDATIRDLRGQVQALEHQVRVALRQPTYDDRNELASARAKADSVYQPLLGRPASDPLPGESPISYRKRMADGLRRFSPQFRDERLDRIPGGAAFDTVEAQIYADAQEAIKEPTAFPAGQLRERTYTKHGREVTEYFGDPMACWGPFAAKPFVARIRKPH